MQLNYEMRDWPKIEKYLLTYIPKGFNGSLYRFYIRRWIQLLSSAAQNSTASLPPQTFGTDVWIGDEMFSINFNVTKTINFLTGCRNLRSYRVPISYFGEQGIIGYTVEPTIGVTDIEVPIIVVPLDISDKEYVVIDGNHRLSERIRLGKQDVDMIIISENTLIQQKLFLTRFDCLLYIALLEIDNVVNWMSKGRHMISLLPQSFILNRSSKMIIKPTYQRDLPPTI